MKQAVYINLFPDAGVLNETTNFTVQVPDPATANRPQSQRWSNPFTPTVDIWLQL